MLILLLASIWLLQPPLSQTHIQPGEFVIDYPAGWELTVDEATGFVYLNAGDLQLTLYSPTLLAAYNLDNYSPETLIALIQALNSVEGGARQPLPDGGLMQVYTRDEISGALLVRVFSDGRLGLVDAFGPPDVVADNMLLIQQIVASFDVPPVPAPESLPTIRPEAVRTLEESGLIPAGGSLVFAEPYVFAAGTDLTQPLAAQLALGDIVLGGNLALQSEAAEAQCSVLARVAGTGGLEVRLDANGEWSVLDRERLLAAIPADTEGHVLLVAWQTRLLVYLDGRLVLDAEVSPGSGSLGLRARAATCELRDLWVYRVPEAGECVLVAVTGAVNKRAEPGVNASIAGVLEIGQSAVGQAQAADVAGFTWWQLADGTWVRADVVGVQGLCAGLPLAAGQP
jgi:hypothetical protein